MSAQEIVDQVFAADDFVGRNEALEVADMILRRLLAERAVTVSSYDQRAISDRLAAVRVEYVVGR